MFNPHPGLGEQADPKQFAEVIKDGNSMDLWGNIIPQDKNHHQEGSLPRFHKVTLLN